jgi:hypothetical protein
MRPARNARREQRMMGEVIEQVKTWMVIGFFDNSSSRLDA